MSDVGERVKVRDMLQSMALDVDRVDREIAEFLWAVATEVGQGGTMPWLTQFAYWYVRARVSLGWWDRFEHVWEGFAAMDCVPAEVLRDIAVCCLANNWRRRHSVNTVVASLCDNPAIPHDLFCDLDSRFGGEGGDLPELGACNPRYANEIARKLILNRPEGFSDAHDVPRHILDGVTCGAVTDEEVLTFLCEPREWSTEYAGEPEYAGGSWSEWTTDDARKLRERLGR